MTTEITDAGAMTVPGAYGDKPLPRRNGYRGMLPGSWLGRSVKLSYTNADGMGVETSGTLLDWCGTGPVFSLSGGKTLISWDRIALVELVAD